jgi:NAD(P)-dependent dehydrogenase (short-subunit alcohol dehydrogenase family)|tara:strand:+ start:58 stop:765 length:708 start_codon:yes stop_codon:yes gene_type:complete
MTIAAPKTVCITGVGRGLGRELASRMIDAGHLVYGSTNRSPSDLSLAGLVAIDLGDEASIRAGCATLAGQIESLDLLINCAGVDARAFGAAKDQRGPFDIDADTFNAVMSVNVTGPMVMTTALLPVLRASSDAMIVNISSQLGSMQVAARQGGDSTYCVSKAALNMWGVKSAAALRPEGISVVMMHPGWVQTDMGGPSGELTVDEAATSISRTISTLSLEDTGRFIRWDGHDHPW